MTVAELIEALKGYPQDATVFVYNRQEDFASQVVEVTPSEDAPNEEVYIDIEEVQ